MLLTWRAGCCPAFVGQAPLLAPTLLRCCARPLLPPQARLGTPLQNDPVRIYGPKELQSLVAFSIRCATWLLACGMLPGLGSAGARGSC